MNKQTITILVNALYDLIQTTFGNVDLNKIDLPIITELPWSLTTASIVLYNVSPKLERLTMEARLSSRGELTTTTGSGIPLQCLTKQNKLNYTGKAKLPRVTPTDSIAPDFMIQDGRYYDTHTALKTMLEKRSTSPLFQMLNTFKTKVVNPTNKYIVRTNAFIFSEAFYLTMYDFDYQDDSFRLRFVLKSKCHAEDGFNDVVTSTTVKHMGKELTISTVSDFNRYLAESNLRIVA